VAFLRRNWTWLIAALSIAGVVLNVLHDSRCFVIWIFTNALWVLVDWRAKLYPQAAIFAVYFVLAVWGLIEWTMP
jgi:nicotinamide riboside transporter PnuC